MLSTVEIHAGPGGIGIYPHHPTFGRPTSTSLLQQMPLASTAIQQQQQQGSVMSGVEFARPKPKNIASMNGLSPSASSTMSTTTQKSSHHEQNGPVNLAVNHQAQLSARGSPNSKIDHSEQKEIDVVGLGSTSCSAIESAMSYPISSSRISSYPSSLGSNAYQALNYGFYGNRYGGTALFPHRSAYPQHHTNRTTYLPSQLDSYPSYLSASYPSNNVGGYSTVTSPQLTSVGAEALAIAHKTISERSHSLSSLNNGHNPYSLKDKDQKSSGSRFNVLEDSQNNNSNNSNHNNFKVPSGKEGSLKHRILTTTRPHDDKHGTINHPANRSSLGNNSLLNFTRGSLIELSNGSLRRVEELRTEDFVMSAEKSLDLQLADSTVVKILSSNNSNCVMITFSYDNNRSKVDIEAKLEHPFFVYGQGWASCNPEGSLTAFGLNCQRLQVGDVCISLKPRESKQDPFLSSISQKRSTQQQQMSQRDLYEQQNQHLQQQESMPQNLSRRLSTTTTSATTGENVISSQMAQYSPALYSLQMSLFAAASQGRIPAPFPPFINDEGTIVNTHLSQDLNTSVNNNSNVKLPPLILKNSTIQDEYIEDLQSRKRRWSAPDIDEDQKQQEQQQTRKIAN
ncbi:CLUMA_CG004860, isoform A [Clunio marinus]|uniref:CLUMA_CG004860, isoform A n=1 Tax=Clunio marinus TaxID=568069 RepID=A0A1J1HSZ0_9DIPT|nr:CLUMA_CG004860, isoform A [Clunio marinus]